MDTTITRASTGKVSPLWGLSWESQFLREPEQQSCGVSHWPRRHQALVRGHLGAARWDESCVDSALCKGVLMLSVGWSETLPYCRDLRCSQHWQWLLPCCLQTTTPPWFIPEMLS